MKNIDTHRVVSYNGKEIKLQPGEWVDWAAWSRGENPRRGHAKEETKKLTPFENFFGMDKNKPVAVIGNGPSILAREDGPMIDACTYVIRFNAFQTEGFEKHTGSKVTHWITNPADHQAKPKPEKRICIYKDFPRSLYNRSEEEIRAGSKQANADKVRPTSGYQVVKWLVESGFKNIFIAGFDGFSKDLNGKHHYWNPKVYSRPPEHDGDFERSQTIKWMKQGKLRLIANAGMTLFHPPPSGAGTELHKLLGRIGLKLAAGCKCSQHIRTMDAKGPQWCRDNIDTIVGWLREEAERRKLPFTAFGSKKIIQLAIRRAERQSAKQAAS